MKQPEPNPTNPSDGQRRVDRAHAIGREPVAITPPSDLIHAIAGHDHQAAAKQLQGQATQLATMLREKQRHLDQRESELNARTALLERDLRRVRLMQQQSRHPVCDNLSDIAEVVENDVETSFEPPEPTTDRPSDGPPSPDAPASRVPEQDETEMDREWSERSDQHQALRLREERLRDRQHNVEQLHEEVTELHRQALELRLATEYVWESLNEDFPGQTHGDAIDKAREQIADHYRLANDTITCRKKQLHALQAELQQQEQRLRHQRREAQMWVDRRQDEIETRLATISLREVELERIDQELQRQSLTWDQQREAYRKQFESLTAKSADVTRRDSA